jgi:hypothetical protein
VAEFVNGKPIEEIDLDRIGEESQEERRTAERRWRRNRGVSLLSLNSQSGGSQDQRSERQMKHKPQRK